MENFTIVRPEHLNHHGVLFGGQMLLWIDEYSWLTAARDFPGCRLVTRAMDDISFKCQVPLGSILRFRILPARIGQTSISYTVKVFADTPEGVRDLVVFTTTVTFVRVNELGDKIALPEIPRPLPSEKVCSEKE